jgi:hypothetical protein
MQNVIYRANRDQDYHDDNVCLHDRGCYGRRNLGEGIACEHQNTPFLASNYRFADKSPGCPQPEHLFSSRILRMNGYRRQPPLPRASFSQAFRLYKNIQFF